MDLTAKELSAIETQLKNEHSLECKYKTYVELLEDPELKQKCEMMAGKHQKNYEKLMVFLN